MSRSNAALILFDIDGTLLRTGDHEHGAAFRHAFETVYGRPVTLEGVPLAGMLDAQIARILFEHHDLERSDADDRLHEMMEAMGQRYAVAIAERNMRERLLPGAVEAVQACIHRQWPAGVLTGNGQAVGHAKLRATGLDTLLTFGAFGDSAMERAHLVEIALDAARMATGQTHERDWTVLVGDTPNDINAARQAGTRVIAVATGRFDARTLASHDPDALLDDLGDTTAFVSAVQRVLA
ncbi:MAG TPA: haloacid dehalogenase-like hydrolase [Thermomicrobiales bacterium]|nr:haloacid dehalogenase-like hydrolase [Thermomicrobiales bacterium]